MNPDWTDLTLTFPDDAKLEDARALKRRIKSDGSRETIAEAKAVPFPDVTDINGIRCDTIELGVIHTPFEYNKDGDVVSGGEEVPGRHMLVITRCRADEVPKELMQYHVDRSDDPSWPRFG